MVSEDRSGPKVLHVDDDEDIRDLVMVALKDVGGLEVIQFGSGAEAIQNAGRIDADLFLLDVMMPGISGPETLEKLRSFPGFASIPAVFLTAMGLESGLMDLMKPGVVSVITKPFDPMTLAEQLTQFWRSSLH